MTASPMIVPPSHDVVAAASSLMGWQAQHGFTADGDSVRSAASSSTPGTGAREALSSGRKVLSFDPAIGKNGAFYFVDVADVTGEPAGALGFEPGPAGPAHTAFRPAAGAAAVGRLPELQHPDQWATAGAASMHAVEHGCAGTPLPGHAAPPPYGAEATLRPWADAPTAGGVAAASRGPGVPVGGPQHQAHPQRWPPHHQQQQMVVSERAAQGSPCTSYCTDSTGALTPLSQRPPPTAGPHGRSETPPWSSISLSRMAMALDEVAQRQRWDMQPPGSVAQRQPQGQAPGRAVAQPAGAGYAPPQLHGGGGGSAERFGRQGTEDCSGRAVAPGARCAPTGSRPMPPCFPLLCSLWRNREVSRHTGRTGRREVYLSEGALGA
jgi:hypothetical protein